MKALFAVAALLAIATAGAQTANTLCSASAPNQVSCQTTVNPGISVPSQPLSGLYEQAANLPNRIAESARQAELQRAQLQLVEAQRAQAEAQRAQAEAAARGAQQGSSHQTLISNDDGALMLLTLSGTKNCRETFVEDDATRWCIAQLYMDDAMFARGMDLVIAKSDAGTALDMRMDIAARTAIIRQDLKLKAQQQKADHYSQRIAACQRLEQATGESEFVCIDRLILSDPDFAEQHAAYQGAQ